MIRVATLVRFGYAYGEFPSAQRQGSVVQKKVLYQLVWPAVAGNVAWAFFTLLYTEAGAQIYERLALLFLIALYLGMEWTYSVGRKSKNKPLSWIADAVLAVAIVWLAISAENGSSPGIYPLLFVFVTSAASHGVDAWTPLNTTRKLSARKSWLYLNIGAVTIALSGAMVEGNPWGLNLVASLALVVGVWWFARMTTVELFDCFRD